MAPGPPNLLRSRSHRSLLLSLLPLLVLISTPAEAQQTLLPPPLECARLSTAYCCTLRIRLLCFVQCANVQCDFFQQLIKGELFKEPPPVESTPHDGSVGPIATDDNNLPPQTIISTTFFPTLVPVEGGTLSSVDSIDGLEEHSHVTIEGSDQDERFIAEATARPPDNHVIKNNDPRIIRPPITLVNIDSTEEEDADESHVAQPVQQRTRPPPVGVGFGSILIGADRAAAVATPPSPPIALVTAARTPLPMLKSKPFGAWSLSVRPHEVVGAGGSFAHTMPNRQIVHLQPHGGDASVVSRVSATKPSVKNSRSNSDSSQSSPISGSSAAMMVGRGGRRPTDQILSSSSGAQLPQAPQGRRILVRTNNLGGRPKGPPPPVFSRLSTADISEPRRFSITFGATQPPPPRLRPVEFIHSPVRHLRTSNLVRMLTTQHSPSSPNLRPVAVAPPPVVVAVPPPPSSASPAIRTNAVTCGVAPDFAPCVDSATASARLLSCCQAKALPAGCQRLCRYNVTQVEVRSALERGECGLLHVAPYLECAAAGNDNTACCRAHGVAQRSGPQCEVFCGPGGPRLGAVGLQHIVCGNVMGNLLRCHYAGIRPDQVVPHRRSHLLTTTTHRRHHQRNHKRQVRTTHFHQAHHQQH